MEGKLRSFASSAIIMRFGLSWRTGSDNVLERREIFLVLVLGSMRNTYFTYELQFPFRVCLFRFNALLFTHIKE
jgi:hypothetical protein